MINMYLVTLEIRAETHVSVCKVSVCCPILTEIMMCQQIIGKLRDIKFHENPFSESRVAICRQADRHDEANRRIFVHLFQRA
jgi:hypothetical protein